MITDDQVREAKKAAPFVPMKNLLEIMRIAQTGMVQETPEPQGHPIEEGYPAPHFADDNGNILWKRSGVWMIGAHASGTPIDATHWRITNRKAAELQG